jgi:hypothetical protein
MSETYWKGNRRDDGVRIVASDVEPERFGITWPNGGKTFACPCCGALIVSARTARFIADHYWPVLKP